MGSRLYTPDIPVVITDVQYCPTVATVIFSRRRSNRCQVSVARRGQIASRRYQFQIACLHVTIKGVRTACQTCHSTPRGHRPFSLQHESGLCLFQVQTHHGLRNISVPDGRRNSNFA
jgi:hypothetical protein